MDPFTSLRDATPQRDWRQSRASTPPRLPRPQPTWRTPGQRNSPSPLSNVFRPPFHQHPSPPRQLYHEPRHDALERSWAPSPRPLLPDQRPPPAQSPPLVQFRPTFFLPKPDRKILSLTDLETFAGCVWKRCLVVCWCSFTLDGSLDSVFVTSSEQGNHAEVQVLKQLEERENQWGRKTRKVVFISSFSPCRQCAEEIIKFVRARGCAFDLWFSKLYKHTFENHFVGLQMLSSEVHMSVSNIQVWNYLVHSTYFPWEHLQSSAVRKIIRRLTPSPQNHSSG